MRYWLISCPRGHYGTGRYVDITFAIAAKDLLSATRIAMKMPMVKHHRTPLCGHEITHEEFIERNKINAYDRLYGME